MAQTMMANSAPDDAVEMLIFDLQHETFAIEALMVREILDPPSETKVPGAAAFVDTVINFRGRVIPVADLRVAFGLERAAATVDSRIVVIELELDRAPTLVGVRADKVHEVASLSLVSTQQAPRVGVRWRQEFVRCLALRGDDLVILPDLANIFSARGEPSPVPIRAVS